MLKGDLVTTPLPAVLRQLADGVVSGCLHIDDGVGGKAKVYLRGGQVYAVQVPGRRPQLGARLVSSGALGPEALAEALEAQRTELQGWRLGELLVHLGYVDQPVVEAFIQEQLREQATDLMRWPTGSWKFRVNERTREDVAPPTPVETLLVAVEDRRQQWDAITEVLHGPDAVPMLSAAGQTDDEMAIDPDAWSLLCKVDGARSVSDLARECGFTLFEAGQVVYSLVRTGLLEVEETVTPEAPAEPAAPVVVAAKLVAALAPSEEPAVVIPAQAESADLDLSPADVANLVANALREDRSLHGSSPVETDEIDASVGRVSQALSEMLGDDSVATDDLFAAPKSRVRGTRKPPKPMTPSEIERERKQAARAEANKKRRAADAEELARAQAELEAARAAEAAAATAELAADHEADVVSLADARQASEERAAAEAEMRAANEAEMRAANEAAEAERQAAAEQAARVAAEAAEAERAAAEAERVAAEAELAAAEAERVAAEEAEAERQAAEAAAAEERARVEAELREAAEKQAAEEAARAEAEAARVEAVRIAAEEAEAERQAAEAAAAEERARAEAELREAAEKQAAEEAARAEAERVAAEEAEAARQAAQIAASEERARVEEELRAAAEAEAAEAARLEAERIAAEEEAARGAAEAAEAERLLAEEAEQSRTPAQRLHAADAFAELSATAATAGDTLVVEAPVDTAVEDEDDLDDEVDDGPLPTYPPADTDMASLFRELSSLGLEDQPAAPAAPAPAPRARPTGTPAAAGKQKKKGLFGR